MMQLRAPQRATTWRKRKMKSTRRMQARTTSLLVHECLVVALAVHGTSVLSSNLRLETNDGPLIACSDSHFQGCTDGLVADKCLVVALGVHGTPVQTYNPWLKITSWPSE